jgi:hypothetical protein
MDGKIVDWSDAHVHGRYADHGTYAVASISSR